MAHTMVWVGLPAQWQQAKGLNGLEPFARSGLNQSPHFALPPFRLPRGAMTRRLRARRNQQQSSIGNGWQSFLHDLQLWWIAFVICRIDGEQCGFDFPDVRKRVVVTRGIPLIQMVVRIAVKWRFQTLIQPLISLLSGRC